MDIAQILLFVIAGATILNGLFMIILLGYVNFQLKNIWMVEMFLIDILAPLDEDSAEELVVDD